MRDMTLNLKPENCVSAKENIALYDCINNVFIVNVQPLKLL